MVFLLLLLLCEDLSEVMWRVKEGWGSLLCELYAFKCGFGISPRLHDARDECEYDACQSPLRLDAACAH